MTDKNKYTPTWQEREARLIALILDAEQGVRPDIVATASTYGAPCTRALWDIADRVAMRDNGPMPHLAAVLCPEETGR